MATFGALIGTAGQAMLESDREMPPHQESIRAARQVQSIDDASFRTSGPENAVQIGRMTSEFQLMWWDKVSSGYSGVHLNSPLL
jgi:hypothetical protein